MRSKLVSLAIATAPGEAYYFPLGHVLKRDVQSELLIDAPGDRAATDAPDDRGLIRGGDDPIPTRAKRKQKAPVASGIAGALLAEARNSPEQPVRNLPALQSMEMKPLRDLLEDPTVRKAGQNSKYDMLVLRKAGIDCKAST
jgi:DNA polymerase I-like protein with 3'-5' exonuclease and polymerase domains